MEEIEKPVYDQTILKILIASIDKIFVYWHVSDQYNNKFIKEYGSDFFIKTKEILVLKNLITGKEKRIEIEEPTNNYYIQFDYSNCIYQVELLRELINDNKETGFKIVSNKVLTPNIKVQLNKYDNKKVKFKNIKKDEEYLQREYYQESEENYENIKRLYDKHIMPLWNEYKIENGYREI